MRMDLSIQINMWPSKTFNLTQKERERITNPYQLKTFLTIIPPEEPGEFLDFCAEFSTFL